MMVLLATGTYAIIGPTVAAPWQILAGSLDGAVEELIFRGAIFRLLWSSLGVWWALSLSSILFGLAHLIKPSADLMAVLGIIFAGGIPMAALYLLTSRLWASIGYHIAWNFTEAYIFGAQVSGTGSGPSLYQVRPVAGVDTLWSGGTFGPEASVANVVMGSLVGAVLLVLANRNAGIAEDRCAFQWHGPAAQPLPHRNAAIEQEGTYLVDDAGALADDPLAHAVQGLQVELVDRLGGDESHSWALHRLGDSFGITEVVLLSF
jgi:membrane protease YdiL (CAAX protease family)